MKFPGTDSLIKYAIYLSYTFIPKIVCFCASQPKIKMHAVTMKEIYFISNELVIVI